MTIHPVRPVLERFAYFCYLTLLVFSIGCTWLGALAGMGTGNFVAMWIAVAGLIASLGLHRLGHAHWHFRECEESLSIARAPDGMLSSEADLQHAAECAALLAQMESAPDVWARGEVRRSLGALLETAPGLREDFAAELARHPDL